MKITFDSNNSSTLSYSLDSNDLYSLVSDHKDELFEIMYRRVKEKQIEKLRKKYGFDSFDYTEFQLTMRGDKGVLIAFSEHPHCGKEMMEEKILDEQDSQDTFYLYSFYSTAKKFLVEG